MSEQDKDTPPHVQLAMKHAREIEAIILGGRDRQKTIDPNSPELMIAKRACSQKILEACGRHTIEMNELSREQAEQPLPEVGDEQPDGSRTFGTAKHEADPS